ncbi:MAG TPA: fibronectin type III domain-containing protein [Longimicrobium sp.]|jgi:hypothetical protein|uniref:fibronectin type III domain-containing protein n=1 Tax=Longimicrobium sp. TaxID=2029185 RepID=UPI002ED7C4CE
MKFNARKLLALAAAMLVAGSAGACDSNSTGSDQPDPPTGVTVTVASPTSVRVSWNLAEGVDSYDVDRAANGTTFANVATGVTGTFFDDNGLSAGVEYTYRVRAVRDGRSSTYSAEMKVITAAAPPRQRVLSGFISSNTTLYADTLYILSGYVKVTNAATLTIQPGTKIVGDTAANAAGSSLWILRGSRIIAEGTAANPIVFTSWRSAGNRKPGDWGGLIIVGSAPINRTATPIYTEGPQGAREDYSNPGGNPAAASFNDNSGSLRYVRIEFAGYDVSGGSGQELNSLSMYAVGRGTKIEYVQAMSGLDDSFEWFGGSVDGRYLVSYESGDDHFDWTEGYRGRNQFLIAVQDTVLRPREGAGSVSSDPRGFEGDGCENDKAGCTYANQPFSAPVFANFTVIGPGPGVFAQTDGNGAVMRRGTAGTLVNGVIARWPGVGISLRDAASNDLRLADSLMVRNVLLAGNGSNFEAGGANFGAALSDPAYGNAAAASFAGLFTAVPASGTAASAAALDFSPAGGSALATGGMASFAGTRIEGRVANYFGGTLTATSYRGAADPNGPKWWQGWTNYALK